MDQKADLTLLVVPLDEDTYQRLVELSGRDGFTAGEYAMMAISDYMRGK